jgi:cell division protein ZapE
MRAVLELDSSSDQALPSARYEKGVIDQRWTGDDAQRSLLPELDRVHEEIRAHHSNTYWQHWLSKWFGGRHVRGLYIHGSVGCGKTFLMDLLHDGLSEAHRDRWHFHRFMRAIHAELALCKGQRDPLRIVARTLVSKPLLFLDEFFVQDIGDAMILGELLKHLMRQGVTLITTSNVAPAQLYADGLQRAKFLPAIHRIERWCRTICLQSDQDYRLRALTAAPIYRYPCDARALQALSDLFDSLKPSEVKTNTQLSINERMISVVRIAQGVAWFEFSSLCDGPRSVADYIEIAKAYNTVVLSEVPQLNVHHEDPARRFMFLVDEFYDRHVKLVIAAKTSIADLYIGERMAKEFARTRSRLMEMQSHAYLALEHRG